MNPCGRVGKRDGGNVDKAIRLARTDTFSIGSPDKPRAGVLKGTA